MQNNTWYCWDCMEAFFGRKWSFMEPDDGCDDKCPVCNGKNTIAVIPLRKAEVVCA